MLPRRLISNVKSHISKADSMNSPVMRSWSLGEFWTFILRKTGQHVLNLTEEFSGIKAASVRWVKSPATKAVPISARGRRDKSHLQQKDSVPISVLVTSSSFGHTLDWPSFSQGLFQRRLEGLCSSCEACNKRWRSSMARYFLGWSRSCLSVWLCSLESRTLDGIGY